MSMGLLGEPTKIECKDSDLKKRILPLLRGRVFHVTRRQTFDAIRATGNIKNNQDGEFPFPYGQSVNSYGRIRGYVCLFDLRNVTAAKIDNALGKYFFLNPFENAHVYLFLSEDVWPYLISWERAEQEKAWGEMFIPDVEAWYPGDIPISYVSDTLVVTVQRSPDPPLIAEMLEASQHAQQKLSRISDSALQPPRKQRI